MWCNLLLNRVHKNSYVLLHPSSKLPVCPKRFYLFDCCRRHTGLRQIIGVNTKSQKPNRREKTQQISSYFTGINQLLRANCVDYPWKLIFLDPNTKRKFWQMKITYCTNFKIINSISWKCSVNYVLLYEIRGEKKSKSNRTIIN